mmetsp:Transcript_20176/g.52029  ORF Transcript_20176/g.52029 Transcript_20176/m.52029 type:complete len:249 (+) Transcript_20176:150-896(+)
MTSGTTLPSSSLSESWTSAAVAAGAFMDDGPALGPRDAAVPPVSRWASACARASATASASTCSGSGNRNVAATPVIFLSCSPETCMDEKTCTPAPAARASSTRRVYCLRVLTDVERKSSSVSRMSATAPMSHAARTCPYPYTARPLPSPSVCASAFRNVSSAAISVVARAPASCWATSESARTSRTECLKPLDALHRTTFARCAASGAASSRLAACAHMYVMNSSARKPGDPTKSDLTTPKSTCRSTA